MNYQIFTPPEHLKSLVQCFWMLESDKYAPIPENYFLMADSCPEIIFQYNEGFKTYSAQSARVRFQHSVSDQFVVGDKVGFFGVRFHPHAVYQLLNIPANEVVNHVCDFADLFGHDGTNLADQVYSAGKTTERIARVSAYLTKKIAIQKIDPFKYFVEQVVARNGAVDIAALQRESGLSVKQFERRFKAAAGFSPKYFTRIARFQAVKDSFAIGRFSSMTKLAYSGNYYDQSHFNREFKEFSGVQPLQYFKRAEQGNNSFSRSGNDRNNEENQLQFDGYLPCGWFV